MTLIPNDYQKGINEAFEISKKEIDALKAENKELNEQLRLHSVSQHSELFAEQDSKDFILWQRDRGIRRLENGKYKWREFEYNREFFLEKYLEDRNKANCG